MAGWRGTARLCLALLMLLMIGCGVKPNPQAAKELAAMAGDVALTVIPPIIRKGDGIESDLHEGARLAAGLVEQGLTATRLGEGEVPLAPGWKSSGSSQWRKAVRGCRRWLKVHPQATPHTLFVQYLLGTRMVAGVQVMIFDGQGRLAYGRVLDTGDPLYIETSPIGRGDCTNLALSALRRDLKLGAGE